MPDQPNKPPSDRNNHWKDDWKDSKGARKPESLKNKLRSALEKAAGYRAAAACPQDEPNTQDDDGVRPLEEWGDIVSQRIEDAMRQGLFDNLSGHGKPLNLDRDPFLPEDQQMAATLLRNNNLSPAWISERNAILDAIETLCHELHLAARQMQTLLLAESEETLAEERRRQWTAWLAAWRQRMDKLNDRILVHNLKQPVAHLEILMLRFSDEANRAGVDPTWVESEPEA